MADLDDKVREFLENHHGAVMVTLKKDGMPHAVRVGVGLVEGRLWSSGTRTRARTGHLRRDPRAVLMVLGASPWQWMTMECTVTILDSDDAVENNLALYRVLAGEPDDLEEYRAAMVKEQRLIYEFSIQRVYGQY